MKNIVFILLGETNSYKTSIMRKIFNCYEKKIQKAKIKLGNKLLCAKNFSSPQENCEFCQVKDVNKDIKKRLDWCKSEKIKNNCHSFILFLPFTIKRKNKE